jgi:hypothetical protein
MEYVAIASVVVAVVSSERSSIWLDANATLCNIYTTVDLPVSLRRDSNLIDIYVSRLGCISRTKRTRKPLHSHRVASTGSDLRV